MLQIGAPIRSDGLGHLEASGAPFGLDFGSILESILGSQAPYAILAKISTAPRREHDFRGSRGPKNEPKIAPETGSSSNVAPRAS